jgi:hypothetical protein
MMSVLARRFGGRMGGQLSSPLGGPLSDRRLAGGARFAVKVIGVGLLAGVLLVVCQFLIDAWFRAIR